MPFYGDPDLFRLAVASVRAQDRDDWRLTVFDDGYPDPRPGAAVAALGDPRIRYIRSDVNRGVTASFTRCVELAEAEYVTIAGCDDLLKPNYVDEVHGLLRAFPDASYVQPAVEVIDESGSPVRPLADRVKAIYRPSISEPTEFGGERLALTLVRGTWTYFPAICWRTDVLRRHGFRSELNVAQDLALQLQIIAEGGTLALGTTVAYEYRRHGGSVSALTAADGTRFDEEAAVLAEAEELARSLGWKRAARAARNRLSSRLNAMTRLPSALLARDASGVRSLVRHIVR